MELDNNIVIMINLQYGSLTSITFGSEREKASYNNEITTHGLSNTPSHRIFSGYILQYIIICLLQKHVQN